MSSEEREYNMFHRFMLFLVVACVSSGAIAIGACASYRDAAKTATDAARIVCAGYFVEQREVPYDKAAADFCATEQQLEPWIDEVLTVKRRIAARRAQPKVTTVYIERDAGQ